MCTVSLINVAMIRYSNHAKCKLIAIMSNDVTHVMLLLAKWVKYTANFIINISLPKI